MLASPALYNVKVKFLRNCTRVIESFLAYYPYLYNYVDARNTKTIQWLEYLGAEISEPRNYGAENLPFHFFSFSGKLKKDKNYVRPYHSNSRWPVRSFLADLLLTTNISRSCRKQI